MNRHCRRTELQLFCAAALLVSVPSLALGDGSLEEIVVTAQRRAEASVDVPISITSISAEALEQSGAQQLSDIAKLTPSLRFDGAGSFIQPTIRGVGTAVATSGGGPNVGIYVDGLFSANPEVSDFQLMRLQGIEVLKGPQGTLFGRNTTGGAILVTTQDPSTEPSAELKASYGRFDAIKVQGYGSLGIGENVAMDLEGTFSQGDGFTKNIITNHDLAGEYENWSMRTGVKVELTDSTSLLSRYTHTRTDDPKPLLANAYVDKDGSSGFLSRLPSSAYGTNDTTGRALVYYPLPSEFSATDPDEIATAEDIAFTNQTDAIQARLKSDLGFAELTFYPQYRKDRAVNHQDLDASAAPLFGIKFGVDDTTVSQEFLLNSATDTNLQWTAGLNYFQARDTWDVNASFGGAPFREFGGSSTLTKSYAGFLDATYQLTPQWFVTVPFSIQSFADARGNACSSSGAPRNAELLNRFG